MTARTPRSTPPRARLLTGAVAVLAVAVLVSCSVTSWSRGSALPGGGAIPAVPAAPAARVTLRSSALEVTATGLVELTAEVVAPEGSPGRDGRITFLSGERVLAEAALVGGVATYANNDLPVGQHDIVALYEGEGSAPATARVALTITPPPTEPFRGPGPSVAVVGDSITLGSKDDIVAALRAGGSDPAVVGLYGYTTTAAKPFVDAFIARSPSIVVLELGTNDITEIVSGVPGRTLEGLQQRMRALTSSFPAACIAVTTVTAQRQHPGPIDPVRWNELARAFNGWLHASYDNVIDWDEAIHAGSASGAPLVVDDELHPNLAGAKALATLDRIAVARCAGGSGS